MKAKLECTTNYDLFDLHECNRDLQDNPILFESMKDHGFMPSSPIHCVENGNGKLKIIRGHHRFDCAKRLGLPIYYIIDKSNTDIFALEGSPKQGWSALDFARARAKAGNKNISLLLEFQKEHGLTLGAAASLIGGEQAGSNNKIKTLKTGSFSVSDMKHAKEVVSVTDLCREKEIPFATSSAFVGAVSMSLFIPEFDVKSFMHKVRLYPASMRKRASIEDYLDEIEALYNYSSKSTRVPVKFRAYEISRERKLTFGGHNKTK
jgi:hypothetical protein